VSATLPARRVTLRGEVEYGGDARAKLSEPGDAVLVRRGRLRSFVILCPDGCGDILTINLDPRAGPAWRLYSRRGDVTLYPSVWRSSGCGAHFIVWRSALIWCGPSEDEGEPPAYDVALERRILEVANNTSLTPFTVIADKLDELPWDVARACRNMVKKNLLVGGEGKDSQSYMLVTP
jgi:hypothetical protein